MIASCFNEIRHWRNIGIYLTCVAICSLPLALLLVHTDEASCHPVSFSMQRPKEFPWQDIEGCRLAKAGRPRGPQFNHLHVQGTRCWQPPPTWAWSGSFPSGASSAAGREGPWSRRSSPATFEFLIRRNCEIIHCYLEPLSVGALCYTAKHIWHTMKDAFLLTHRNWIGRHHFFHNLIFLL